MGYNTRLNLKVQKHPNPYVLSKVLKDELKKSSVKANSVEVGSDEARVYRRYVKLKKGGRNQQFERFENRKNYSAAIC